jgi:hypothetical protein
LVTPFCFGPAFQFPSRYQQLVEAGIRSCESFLQMLEGVAWQPEDGGRFVCLATFRWIRIAVQTTCGADSPVVCEKVPVVHSVPFGVVLPDETGNGSPGAELLQQLLEVLKLLVNVGDVLVVPDKWPSA